MQTETLTASPVLEASYNTWLERGLLPDWLIRIGIRRLVSARLRKERQGTPDAIHRATAPESRGNSA